MPTIHKTIEHEIEISPEELASLFIGMTNDQQARFFNTCQAIVDNDWDSIFGYQMASIMEAPELNNDGKKLIATIADFFDGVANSDIHNLIGILQGIHDIIQETPEPNFAHTPRAIIEDAKRLDRAMNEIWEMIDSSGVLKDDK